MQLVPENAKPGTGGLPIDIAPGPESGLLNEVYTGRDLPAGVCEGSVTVSAGGSERHIPVELTLFDFTLPDENSMSVMLYFEAEQLPLYLGEDVEDRFHRFAPIGTGSSSSMNTISARSPRRPAGSMERTSAPAPGTRGPARVPATGSRPRASTGRTRETEQKGSAEDASDAWMTYLAAHVPGAITFLYMPDEPGSGQFDEIQGDAPRQFHDNPGPGRRTANLRDLLVQGRAQRRDRHLVCADPSYDIQVAQQQRAAGRRYWFYNGHRPHTGALLIDTPATDARANAWTAFKDAAWTSTTTGTAITGSTTSRRSGRRSQDVWADPVTFDNRGQPGKPLTDQGFINGDGVLVYPGKEVLHPEQGWGIAGPVSTIQLAKSTPRPAGPPLSDHGAPARPPGRGGVGALRRRPRCSRTRATPSRSRSTATTTSPRGEPCAEAIDAAR